MKFTYSRHHCIQLHIDFCLFCIAYTVLEIIALICFALALCNTADLPSDWNNTVVYIYIYFKL